MDMKREKEREHAHQGQHVNEIQSGGHLPGQELLGLEVLPVVLAHVRDDELPEGPRRKSERQKEERDARKDKKE